MTRWGQAAWDGTIDQWNQRSAAPQDLGSGQWLPSPSHNVLVLCHLVSATRTIRGILWLSEDFLSTLASYSYIPNSQSSRASSPLNVLSQAFIPPPHPTPYLNNLLTVNVTVTGTAWETSYSINTELPLNSRRHSFFASHASFTTTSHKKKNATEDLMVSGSTTAVVCQKCAVSHTLQLASS